LLFLNVVFFARSAGQTLTFRGEEIVIQELREDSFQGIDIALFSAGGGISETFAPIAAESGCIVIDNSSAFRMDSEVPLVVPEINPQAAQQHPRNIIANPNCSTIITLMGLAPLHRAFGLTGLIASTYQAVSGSGAQGIAELESQVQSLVAGTPIEKKVYPHQIAHNVIPHVDVFQDSGYTKEEQKMLHEGRKILDLPELKVTCTCVRVPVMRSHSISVTAIFEKDPTLAEAQAVFRNASGVELRDNPSQGLYSIPSPAERLSRPFTIICSLSHLRSPLRTLPWPRA